MRRLTFTLALMSFSVLAVTTIGSAVKLTALDEYSFPTPGNAGALLFGTDAGTVYVDDGTQWTLVASSTSNLYAANIGPERRCFNASNTYMAFGIGRQGVESLAIQGTQETVSASSTISNANYRWLTQPFRVHVRTSTTAPGQVAWGQLTASGATNPQSAYYSRQHGFAWFFRVANSKNNDVNGPLGQTPIYFLGLRSGTTFDGGCLPSTFTNTIYVGCEAGDDNFSICSNDGSGSATCTSLGTNFKCRNGHTFMDINLVARPEDTSSVEYYIVNVETGDIAQGTLASDLPPTTTFLSFGLLACNGSDGGTTAFGYTGACVWTP